MSDTTPETPSPAPAPSLEWTLRPRADKDGWTLLLNGLIKAGGSWQHCLNALDAALRQATQQPAALTHPVNYDAPTPETDEFMTQIDDSEIDLGQVQSKFSDFENERDAARARIAELERERDRMRSINTRMLVRGLRAEGSENCPFCEQYQPTGHAQESPQCAMCFLEEKYDTARASLAAVEKERDALRAWKDSAMSLTPPLQEIGRELAMPLGASVPERILPGIKSLKAALAAAQERVKALEADGARLDTLSELMNEGYYLEHQSGHFVLWIEFSNGQEHIMEGSIREVIDQARAQSSEEGRP